MLHNISCNMNNKDIFIGLLYCFYFRYLFWTEFGSTTEVVRANMDGTSKSYIATTQIGWPNGLTIDFKCNVCTFFYLKFISLMFFFTFN